MLRGVNTALMYSVNQANGFSYHVTTNINGNVFTDCRVMTGFG